MGNKNYSRCAIHTWSIYNVEYFIMSHQGNTELEESKEEDRLEEERLEELAQLEKDHEFLEKVYATVPDKITRQQLIRKYFWGEDK